MNSGTRCAAVGLSRKCVQGTDAPRDSAEQVESFAFAFAFAFAVAVAVAVVFAVAVAVAVALNAFGAP